VARNRTNLELAGEVEGESSTLAEHFKRGNAQPIPSVYQLVGEVEGESSTLAEHFKRGNAESIPSVYQLVGEEEEGETQGLRRPRISWDGGAGGGGGGGSEDF